MVNTLIFFAERMQKLFTFLQQKYQFTENNLAITVNEFVINEHIKLRML